MLRRIWALFIARNKEFYRDKSAFLWYFLLPFLIILGFTVMFSQEDKSLYKVGVIRLDPTKQILNKVKYDNLKKTKFIKFIEFNSKEIALKKLKRHRLDLLIDMDANQYWVSESSPNGYVAERLLLGNTSYSEGGFGKQSIKGKPLPYAEWLLPGILSMNIMFAGLYGVGYSIVRYRKNGVLKRLSVTPVRPWEFLMAQILSRMFLIVIVTLIVFCGCMMIFGFEFHGSYLNLIFIFALGGFCLITVGLIVSARSSSEEFANGALNLITWPMMLFSEVWFSMEGATPWVQKASRLLPLTSLVDAMRKIMNDGAGLFDIQYQIISLVVMSLIFLLLGSLLFKWHN